MGNSFASYHFEYLLRKTAVLEIVKDCPQTRDMPEKNEDDWINKAICFYQRTLPQLHSCCGWGTHSRRIANWSGSLFVALVDANYCLIDISLEGFAATEFSETFSGSQPRQGVEVLRRFRSCLLPHLQGVTDGLVEPKLINRCPTVLPSRTELQWDT